MSKRVFYDEKLYEIESCEFNFPKEILSSNEIAVAEFRFGASCPTSYNFQIFKANNVLLVLSDNKSVILTTPEHKNFQLNKSIYLILREGNYLLSSEFALFIYAFSFSDEVLNLRNSVENPIFKSVNFNPLLVNEWIELMQKSVNPLRYKIAFLDFLLVFNESNSQKPQSINHQDLKQLYAISQKLSADSTTLFNINQCATEAGMSTTKFKTNFKKVFGKTPYIYFLYHKMHYAKKLILYEKKSIAAVSEELGYNNSSNFSKAFKKITSQLPSKILNG
jgi:AraC-like DNA-binding protein